MLCPGASKDRKDALFEKLLTTSLFVVLPTLMAEEMHAGWLIASVNPLFPDAIADAIFTERKF
jgi:hypothetical protein